MKLQWTLLLLACVVVRTQGQAPEAYRTFLSNHVNPTMTKVQCSNYMRTLRLTEPSSPDCKSKNTFILVNSGEVNKICNQAGTRVSANRDHFVSNQPFPVLNCISHSGIGVRPPRCEYRGTDPSTRKLTLGCVPDQTDRNRRWPTHYVGDTVIVG